MKTITPERRQNSRSATERAVDYYIAETYPDNQYEQREVLDRTRRIRDYINIFAGDVLPPEAIDAGVLYEVRRGEMDSTPGMITTASSLMEYYTSPGVHPGSAEYVAALLNDMEYMDGHAKWYHRNATYLQHKNGGVNAWSKPLPPISINEMGALGKEVNIESILVKSCIMVDKLVVSANEMMQYDDTSKPDDEVLDDIIESETFYGPLCEVFGFDGLAMELRSQSRKMRMLKEGRAEDILRVQEYCATVRKLGPGAVLANIAGDDNFAISSAVNQPEYLQDNAEVPYISVQLGEFAMDLGDGKLVAGNWRLKSVGSLVDKIFSKERGVLPMDVMGLTVILQDEHELADTFAEITKRVQASQSLQGKPAPSKTKWAFVQGDEDFRRMVREACAPEFIDGNVQILDKDKGYRVAKFTCLADNGNMPVEMQFLTKADRKNARTGPDAHIIYKAQMDGVFYTVKERRRAAEVLYELHNRKFHMTDNVGTLQANPESLIRGTRDMQRAYVSTYIK